MQPELIDRREARRRARAGAAHLLRARLRPPPELTVSQWADLHRILPATSAERGRWRTSRTPYLREIMDSFCDATTERVVFMKAAQIGGSEALLNVLGFFIDQDPAPVLLVQTSDGEAAKFSKERIAPMINECPVLAAKVKPPRSREGGNTIDSKEYPGGHLGIVGANAPAKLRSRPRRVVLFDEVDGYPPSSGSEGDPVELGVKRTSTYWNRKIGMISTPTVRGASRIEKAFEESDQRYYFVPCPHCDHTQRLVWERLRWEKAQTPDGPVALPETAHYVCEACEQRIEEKHKARMLESDDWRPTRESRIKGYHLSALYSPWFTWESLVREWLSAKEHPALLRVFVNTRLAETFEERGDAPEWGRIYERRESFPMGSCPDGVVFITAGVDVQKDRIEAYVWGWGYGRESWLIDHHVIEGDPYIDGTWTPLTDLLGRTWPAPLGVELPIARLAIDTGFAQETVVAWAQRVGDRRVMLVKGDHWKNWTVIVGAPTKSEVTFRGQRYGLLLWPVGGALIKQETYGFLRLPAPLDGDPYPPGWIHLPQVDDEIVKQLVAEELLERTDKNGFPTREWVKKRHRNEALDCRVYARAAAEQHGLGRMIAEPPAPQPTRPQVDDNDSRRGNWVGRGGTTRRGGWLK